MNGTLTLRIRDASHLECAEEQIQWIGQIQAYGMLLGLSEPALTVCHLSSNVPMQLDMPAASILGHCFAQLLGAQQFDVFRTAVAAHDGCLTTVIRLTIHGSVQALQCTVHRQDGLLILEIELEELRIQPGLTDIDTHIRLPLARMESARDIAELSRVAALEIQRLSGFGRVMIYRFDEEWNGEVVAEVAEPSAVPYLGLHFPASDIPPQARALFAVNPLRLIADVSSDPIPILPTVIAATGRRLDLTRSLLRSASPLHIEYLRNMAVMSSMTISIVVKHRLWGMIACHDSQPRRVDHSTRAVALLFGATFASQVALRLDNAGLQRRLESRDQLKNIIARVEASSSPLKAPQLQDAKLLDLFGADGMIASFAGATTRHGETPDYEAMLPVIERLRRLAAQGVSSSRTLLALDPLAARYRGRASGALYIGVDEAAGEFLLLLRKELIEQLIWAGDPEHALTVDAAGHPHPRTSFEAWHQTVRGCSKAWSAIDLENASSLREQLLRLGAARQLAIVNQSLLREIAERKRAEANLFLAQKLESVGRLAAGIAHEINTPIQFVGDNVTFLRTACDGFNQVLGGWRTAIDALPDSPEHQALRLELEAAASQSDMDFLRTEMPKAFDSIFEGVTRVTNIVKAMKEFAHPDANEQAAADINHAICTTVLVAYGEYKYLANIHTDFAQLPLVVCNISEINQVLLNLIVNAAHAIGEAGRDLSTGEIRISTALEGNLVVIRIADNGCGIAPENLSRLYDPFFTTKEVGRGTGQGLAISYSILVDNHCGHINVASTVGVGTEFTLRLPVDGRDGLG